MGRFTTPVQMSGILEVNIGVQLKPTVTAPHGKLTITLVTSGIVLLIVQEVNERNIFIYITTALVLFLFRSNC